MKRKEYRKGAASFYVVAFSTLILLVIVASFTALVVAQITRTSNDDLSQSAYDAALAGVEDAKLAFYNYQSCIAQGVAAKEPDNSGRIDECGEIIWAIEHANDEAALKSKGLKACDIVGKVLGRTIAENGVMVTEGKESNMQEWYTCTKIDTVLKDYRATLSSSSQIKSIQPKFKNIDARRIKSMRLSWGANLREAQKTFTSGVSFPQSGKYNPPALAVALVQAEKGFKMNDLYISKDGQTNSGMVYLVPRKNSGDTVVPASTMTASNDKVSYNNPVDINCAKSESDEFACTATIMLPEPIDSNPESTGRYDDNFIIAVMLPYGESTDFALEFFCAEEDEEGSCGREIYIDENGELRDGGPTNQASLEGIQIAIDSTGRANDLFRRVETRLEGNDAFAMTLMGPLELVGGSGGGGTGGTDGLKKDMIVTCEYNFGSDGAGCLEPTEGDTEWVEGEPEEDGEGIW